MYICMNTYMYKNQPCEHSHIFFQEHFLEHDWDYVDNPDIFHSHEDSILRTNNLHIVRILVSHNAQCTYPEFHESAYKLLLSNNSSYANTSVI